MMYPLHLLKTKFFFPVCIWFIHFPWNLFCFFFCFVVAGVGEDDSRRPGGGPRSQQQQQAQMNQTLHSELALSKEQLYDLFQQILGVKKFEHQLLFNALQVRIYVDYTIFIINICSIRKSSSTENGCWTIDINKMLRKNDIFFSFVWQLDSSDEQAAAIRRELDGRLQKVAEMEKVLFFFHLSPHSFLPRSTHPHGSDAYSMFLFAFYSLSTL